MITKIILLAVCAVALVLSYKGKWVLETFKFAEPNEKNIMKLKFAALIIAAAAFVLNFFI